MYLKISQNAQETTWRPATLLKRDSNTGVSCEICKIFKNTFFNSTLSVAAFVHYTHYSEGTRSRFKAHNTFIIWRPKLHMITYFQFRRHMIMFRSCDHWVLFHEIMQGLYIPKKKKKNSQENAGGIIYFFCSFNG